MSDVQVLGLLRWSYPAAPGAFKMQFGETMDQIRQAVYAPQRLNMRLFFLEHIVLPCLRAQGDQDFRIVMLLGETLPEPYRGRLLDLIADVPQITPVFAPEGIKQMDICAQVVREARDPDRPVSAEFWADDDDAVAVDFVRLTRRLFRQMRGVYEGAGKLGLDFSKGMLLQANVSGGVEMQQVVARQWTPALVHYLPSDGEATVANFHHARLWKRLTVLSWPRKVMYVRGAHEFNVSSVNRNPVNASVLKADPAEFPEIMQKRFGIDVERFDQAWRAQCKSGVFGG